LPRPSLGLVTGLRGRDWEEGEAVDARGGHDVILWSDGLQGQVGFAFRVGEVGH